MKKGISLFLTIAMLLSMLATGAMAEGYTAGTYTGTAAGRNGDVTVEVVVSNTAIESVTVTAQQETAGVANPALEQIPAAIVTGQTLAVDAIAGATITSDAILAAAESALTAAGADIDALKTPKADHADAAPVEDMTTDVLVVGGGLAGLASAVSAREQGAEVILVEKMAATGGTSALSGGGIAAPGSHLQVENGIVDSPAAYVNEWKMYQSFTARDGVELDSDRMLFLAKSGAELIEWLEGYGFEFGAPTSFGMVEGVDRFHYPSNLPNKQTGKMTEVATEKGANILLNTRATKLVTDENGAVIGCKMEQNGQTFTIYAKAVVLATGGYSWNDELVARLCPENLNTLHVASIGSTGDGLIMAEEVGAALYENQWLMGMSYSVSQDGNTLNNLGGPWTISMMVDRDGNRFMNENLHPNAYSNMILRGKGPYYTIVDSSDEAKAAICEENVGCEYLVKGDTLEELAQNAGFDVDTFVGWVYNWNNGIKNGYDAFGARIAYMAPIEKGPFYAVRQTPTNMDSMGGIKTNLEAEVLRGDGTSIQNLYAAGAISNGALYDTAYMSGSAVLNCYTMGRIAGKNAAALAK